MMYATLVTTSKACKLITIFNHLISVHRSMMAHANHFLPTTSGVRLHHFNLRARLPNPMSRPFLQLTWESHTSTGVISRRLAPKLISGILLIIDIDVPSLRYFPYTTEVAAEGKERRRGHQQRRRQTTVADMATPNDDRPLQSSFTCRKSTTWAPTPVE
ncbi:hypothetical protein ANN_08392 [Periplaneta americana]|uniref:Uncharacterized protein n=1 Tax=Periplaneta americana TaxID=6978 RepID=A0ABQ8T2P3_PERAM|nr:hypothetical protein ANN_08392 [Periplaneta americana]